jgi:two-component system, OmpR family, phosphate regulon sensor histidine kinase PhoR
MNKNLIKLIIFVISIVLLSLIIVQGYWVKNAIIVERDSFENKVNEAVNVVINKLEKLEVHDQLLSTLKKQSDVNRFISSIDSISMLLSDTLFAFTDTEELKKVLLKTLVAREVFDEMMLDIKPVDMESVITRSFLDSLLNSEFLNNGIVTKYEFGIYSSSKQELIFDKAGQDKSKLMSDGFKYTLYPSESAEYPDHLIIYFPNKIRYLLKQTAGMILISLILIFIILMLFIYVIKIIVWQNRLSEMKTDFINNMTHEIKTPISTISLACEALNDVDIKKNEMLATNYLKVISLENDRLAGIAEKILQNALIEKEDFKLKLEKTNLHEIAGHIIQNLSIHVEVKDGKITKNFKAEPAVIYADKWHLSNVLSNLIDNATKYSPRKPEIKVVTGNYAEGVFISVIDNGMGISKENQKKIFDRLYRVPTGNVHDVKGFGLGLSYVKNIVERHGGSITVNSELKKGSTFTVYLPFSGKRKKAEK